ncbi:MAG TPA: sugar kinase [Chloroflexi bacterium]|nr:sugar kinase [Chloroflexota bacterium]
MSKRVLVIGELNVDVIVSGLPDLPALGQEMLASGLHIVMGSSSANCAAGMARLGARVDFLGKVGIDYYGDFVIGELKVLGVDTQLVLRDNVIRTGVTISLTYPEDRAMVTYLGCIPNLRLDDVKTSILWRYQHLHVGSYFLQQGLRPGLPALFDQARHAGLTVSLDTGHDPNEGWAQDALRELLPRVDFFLPNEEEACAIASVDDAEDALRALSEHARHVIVKRGPVGSMTLVEGQVVRVPGFQVDTVDTTGAGDSFDAGFIYARVVEGQSMEESLRFANACGALSTTGYGGTAAQPRVGQARALIKQTAR